MKKKYKLLIVEDNKTERDLLVSYMSKKEIFHSIYTATTGTEAIIQAKHEKPDIILLDIILPGGQDGVDVLEAIQGISPKPKVIVTSGLAFDENTINLIKLGAVYYILKPYSLDMIYRRILNIFEAIEEDSILVKISGYLHLLGISTALKGYHYVREAIYLSIINRKKDYALKTIYEIIAKKNQISSKSVERGIDNAIDRAMQRNTANTYFNFFGNTINDIRCKPTSREFISAVVDKILLENKELDKLYNESSD